MITKALEAAAIVHASQSTGRPWANMSADERESRAGFTAQIIRAFGQNLSEEAAEKCEVEWSGCHYQCGGTQSATPALILAAIERDLA